MNEGREGSVRKFDYRFLSSLNEHRSFYFQAIDLYDITPGLNEGQGKFLSNMTN